jgi:hypothetical protein
LSIAAAKSSVNGKISDRPLAAAVQQMIARRQSIISEGGIPTPPASQSSFAGTPGGVGMAPLSAMGRPHIRFLVRPDGLRSYYQAYPELEGLQLQMTRQNLEPDDDVTRHMISR